MNQYISVSSFRDAEARLFSSCIETAEECSGKQRSQLRESNSPSLLLEDLHDSQFLLQKGGASSSLSIPLTLVILFQEGFQILQEENRASGKARRSDLKTKVQVLP